MPNLATRALSVLLLLVCTASLGCQRVNTVEREEPLSDPNFVDKRVSSPDLTLSRSVRVLNVREGSTADGRLMKIEVEVRNKTSRTKSFKYRFDWVDTQGMTVRSPLSGWTLKTIQPKEQLFIGAVAPSPDAVDFRLKLIEP